MRKRRSFINDPLLSVIDNSQKLIEQQILDITNYNGYFHDGYLRNLTHKGSQIEFFLESSIINPEDFSEKALLTNDMKIKGVLTASSIISIIIDDQKTTKPLKMEYDYAEILTLKTDKKKVYLLIEWDNYSSSPECELLSEIIVEAENIHWESMTG